MLLLTQERQLLYWMNSRLRSFFFIMQTNQVIFILSGEETAELYTDCNDIFLYYI